MTIDEARAELRFVRNLECIIAERKKRLIATRNRACGIRVCRLGESVGSADKDRVERCLDKLRSLEEDLLEEIPRVEMQKAAIMSKIEVLPYPYCEILSRYYVQGQPVSVIARLMHYERRYMYCILNKGVEKYARIGEKTQKDTKTVIK